MDTNGRNYCFNKFVSISIHSWLNPGCECVAVGNPQFKMLEKFDERNRGPIVNINGQVGPMAKWLSELYVQRTAMEGFQVV